MEEAQVLQYVRSVAIAVGLPLEVGRAESVAQHLLRTVAIANLLESAPLAAEDEPAEVYLPAPFPPPESA